MTERTYLITEVAGYSAFSSGSNRNVERNEARLGLVWTGNVFDFDVTGIVGLDDSSADYGVTAGWRWSYLRNR